MVARVRKTSALLICGTDKYIINPLGSSDVIVQMFEWSWDSVASECANFLGPMGYGLVQGRESPNVRIAAIHDLL